MKTNKEDITTVTGRGQTSIPAHLRQEMSLTRGRQLHWERVGDRELRLVVLEEQAEPAPGASAMRGFARTFRTSTKSTAEWMSELRDGEG